MTTKTPKTKLTKAMREEFVHAVLAGINTKLPDDEIRKFVKEYALRALPADVRKLYEHPDTSAYVNSVQYHFEGLRHQQVHEDTKGRKHTAYGYYYSIAVQVPGNSHTVPPALKAKVLKIQQECLCKMIDKEKLQERLPAMAAACNNVEELEDMFPALASYIPKPVVVSKSMVPAVLIKDTMKELRRLGVPPKVQAAVAA